TETRSAVAAGVPPACTSVAADTAASTERESAVQRLSRLASVGQNFSNRRRKVIDAGTGHDDAVAAAVSFLGDAQESPAVVLPELHVEMLALDLQFSRLDDVIHFYLRPPTLPHPVWAMEAKSAGFRQFLLCEEKQEERRKASLATYRQRCRCHGLRHWLLNLESRARVRTNALR